MDIWYSVKYIWAATWQNQQNECAPSKDSDQPGHPPSLISVFAVRMKKAWILSYPLSGQRRLWSDWADAQADLSLRWAHTHFAGFIESWFTCRMDIWYSSNVPGKNIYWLTKETLHTSFANSSNKTIEIWYLLYSTRWVNATVLFATTIIAVHG